MISRFFSWLENYVDSFPEQKAEKPSPKLFAFAFHYTKPFLPLLIASILFSTGYCPYQVYLFAFIGNLVDLLSTGRPRQLLGSQCHQIVPDGHPGFVGASSVELHFRNLFPIRACAVPLRCAFAGWHTAMCCAKAWISSTMIMPAAWQPRSCTQHLVCETQ